MVRRIFEVGLFLWVGAIGGSIGGAIAPIVWDSTLGRHCLVGAMIGAIIGSVPGLIGGIVWCCVGPRARNTLLVIFVPGLLAVAAIISFVLVAFLYLVSLGDV